MTVDGGPQLRDASWRPVSIDAVHLAFLRAEWLKIDRPEEHHLVDKANLSSESQNERRRELLYGRRAPLVSNVPGDTAWHDVRHLEREHLRQLLVIGGNCGWDDRADRNEPLRVANRRNIALQDSPERWDEPILWGHTTDGPFTILEGNNRLVAYTGMRDPPPLKIAVYAGLSPPRCVWHRTDSDA